MPPRPGGGIPMASTGAGPCGGCHWAAPPPQSPKAPHASTSPPIPLPSPPYQLHLCRPLGGGGVREVVTPSSQARQEPPHAPHPQTTQSPPPPQRDMGRTYCRPDMIPRSPPSAHRHSASRRCRCALGRTMDRRTGQVPPDECRGRRMPFPCPRGGPSRRRRCCVQPAARGLRRDVCHRVGPSAAGCMALAPRRPSPEAVNICPTSTCALGVCWPSHEIIGWS